MNQYQVNKGIILAGGIGSRLRPLTLGVSKQLLPVYDKPMIYYPLSVLMLAGVQNILIITTKHDADLFQRALGDGSQWGLRLSYVVQDSALGVAHGLLQAKTFVGNDSFCCILGDNFFYGQGFTGMLQQAMQVQKGASAFLYPVRDVSRFGAATLAKNNSIIESIVEKPSKADEGWAVTGLYLFDAHAITYAQELRPSARGELEVTELLTLYLKAGKLNFQLLGRGFSWLDMGTSDALLEASHFVQTLEKHQGFKIACLEEIAWGNDWIDDAMLMKRVEFFAGNEYGQYLESIIKCKCKYAIK